MNYKSNWRTKLPYKYNVLSSEVWKYSRLFSLTQSLPKPSFFGLNVGSEFQSRGASVALCLLQALSPCRGWASPGGTRWLTGHTGPSSVQNEGVERTRPQIRIYTSDLAVPLPLQRARLTSLCSHKWHRVKPPRALLCQASPWNGAWPHGAVTAPSGDSFPLSRNLDWSAWYNNTRCSLPRSLHALWLWFLSLVYYRKKL